MPPARDPWPLATETRRDFLRKSALATALVASGSLSRLSAASETGPGSAEPWYRRVRRWGQTNITEADPARYDLAWWRDYWKRTQVQGVIVNAGGIVAYYPTEIPHHHRAQFLGDRDLFGDLARAAREDGLVVFARMDSNSAHDDFYQAHPDWFARDASGRPYRNRELYIACVNGPYYEEHIPAVIREIATRYRPEGFTDNSWSGLGRGSICYCDNCQKKFRAASGHELPRRHDWNDAGYRAWIEWSYARRIEIWDTFNRVARAAGGPQCLWVGMNGGSVSGQAREFRDCKEIFARAEILMLDDQRRQNESGFQRNGEVGKFVHGVMGWDKIAPESMALYQTTNPTYRLGTKPAPEARLWMLEGIAAGIAPWWHHVGAWQEDRRQFATAEPVMCWHQAHEAYLFNRTPVATVGVVWSQRHTDFFGREDTDLLADSPARGWTDALVRARIPYLPVHLDHVARDAAQLRVLILPNLAALTDAQGEGLRKFVADGGALIATGQSSLCDHWGDPRPDFALADVFGVHLPAKHGWRDEAVRRRHASENAHSYIRLTPSLAARAPGPHAPTEKPATGASRHQIFAGFDDTDILGFGGTLEPLQVDATARVLATFVPSFPGFPPETSWMREPVTDIPALVLNERPGAGRVAYLVADLDRRYARDNLPDHGALLANLVRWAARDTLPLRVEGAGLIDCHLYRQENRLILHLVNLTSAGTWRAPVEELIPVGPLRVSVRASAGGLSASVRTAHRLVAGGETALTREGGWLHLTLDSVLDHEVLVFG